MRKFTYITVGKILNELKREGISLSRATFYRLESKLGFPVKEKTGGSWRVYSPSEADEVIGLIKKNYRLEDKPLDINSGKNALDYITKLYELKNKGIVTTEEFETKKRQLLGI